MKDKLDFLTPEDTKPEDHMAHLGVRLAIREISLPIEKKLSRGEMILRAALVELAELLDERCKTGIGTNADVTIRNVVGGDFLFALNNDKAKAWAERHVITGIDASKGLEVKSGFAYALIDAMVRDDLVVE